MHVIGQCIAVVVRQPRRRYRVQEINIYDSRVHDELALGQDGYGSVDDHGNYGHSRLDREHERSLLEVPDRIVGTARPLRENYHRAARFDALSGDVVRPERRLLVRPLHGHRPEHAQSRSEDGNLEQLSLGDEVVAWKPPDQRENVEQRNVVTDEDEGAVRRKRREAMQTYLDA